MISAYYDTEGIIWIGTQGGGVYASDLRKQFYQRFHQETHNEICEMAMDKNEYIWLATFHKGILRSTEPFNPQSRLEFESVPAGSSNTVLCVLNDKKGNLWFGNGQSELIQYDSENKKPLPFILSALKNKPEWSGSIWSLLIDNQNRLWVGTTNGLLLFDRQTKRFYLLPCRFRNHTGNGRSTR